MAQAIGIPIFVEEFVPQAIEIPIFVDELGFQVQGPRHFLDELGYIRQGIRGPSYRDTYFRRGIRAPSYCPMATRAAKPSVAAPPSGLPADVTEWDIVVTERSDPCSAFSQRGCVGNVEMRIS